MSDLKHTAPPEPHNEVRREEGSGLYVHIPFCLKKCSYCDFYSIIDTGLIDSFLDGLEAEAGLYTGRFHTFDSLYVGGGTPSLLTDRQMARLFSLLRSRFTFEKDSEITVEVNADDLNPAKLEALLGQGANRLSIGVQSFSDKDLAFLGRRHDGATARMAIGLAKEAGFGNIGVDLIYGLPDQTVDAWIETLDEALAFTPAHLSCYQLTIEERTPLGQMGREGHFEPPGEEREAELFTATSRHLQDKGYIHYEVSNFARSEGLCSRHNRKYWRHVPYVGLGPAAHSFDGRERWWNVRSVVDYCGLTREGRVPVGGREELTEEQLRLERLFLGFRTSDGVALKDAEGWDRPESDLGHLVASGLLKVTGSRIVPTREAFLIADRLPLMV